MSADALIEGLPDLVVLIRRDGLVLECGGGHGVPGLRRRLDAAGKRIESLWPAHVAEFLKLLMRRSLALRTTAEARLEHDGIAYEARARARGPERALCIIRQASASSRDDSLEGSDERPLPQLDPIAIGGAEFHLTPYAGVAILGQDATTPKLLLDHARAAATEARRRGSSEVCFFTDTMRLESLARLDIAREMREAIANRDIRLRYVGRHDLETGRLTAWVGYLRWLHPLRGEIRPAEFLRVAETTGLAAQLSRAVLGCLKEDFASLAAASDPDVRVSFGALRHHVLHEDFAADIGRFLAEGALPPERLELRIAERALVARDPLDLHDLAQLGARVVVDEVARGMGSPGLLARAPLWGL